MVKKRLLLIFVLLFALPALACSLFQTQDQEDTATQIAADIYATWTAGAPTATYTATVTPTETVTPTPTITDTPLPTETPKPTVPSEPTFGAITFARGASEDSQPIDPSTKFPPGITTVYACCDYWGMNPELQFTRSWYNNGEEWVSNSKYWDRAENGTVCSRIYWLEGGGLPTGNWEVKLYIDNELVQSGTFTIGD